MAATHRAVVDVCVIGGGPAGSTSACRLAALGYDVLLVERRMAPRSQVAATLPPTILPLLDLLDLRQPLERLPALHLHRKVVWWASAEPDISEAPSAPSLHVERTAFDSLLLRHAATHGVRVLPSSWALPPTRLAGGGWRIKLRDAGNTDEVVSRFVVDASGGSNLLPGRPCRAAPPLIALWACTQDRRRMPDAVCIEAGSDAWFWSAPLANGRRVVAAFTDPKQIAGQGRQGAQGAYRRLLEQFSLLRGHAIPPAAFIGASDASLRMADDVAGPNHIRVGDASVRLDPLSSQGVLSAIASATQAASVINTIVRCPENQATALQFYRDRQQERFGQHAAKTAALYRARARLCDRPFWRRRADLGPWRSPPPVHGPRLAPDFRLRLSPQASIEPTPMLSGDLISPAPGLHHPNLERPVVYLGGVAIGPLLTSLRTEADARDLVQRWSARMPSSLAWSILAWLWDRQVVVTPNAGGLLCG